MKGLEKIIVEKLHMEVEPALDQRQCAYTKSDAMSTILHLLLGHLEENMPDCYSGTLAQLLIQHAHRFCLRSWFS